MDYDSVIEYPVGIKPAKAVSSDVVMKDGRLNSRLMQCSYYIAWIGDVNRNGMIEIIMETFEGGMGNQFDFIEKQIEYGRTVLKSIMTYGVNASD